MIDTAKQKAVEHNINNIQFFRTDLLDKNFQTASFEVITAFIMLQYVPAKQHLYEKIHEFLKPHGLFISSTVCHRERKSALRFMMAGLTRLKKKSHHLVHQSENNKVQQQTKPKLH